jgi:hypothetical protein
MKASPELNWYCTMPLNLWNGELNKPPFFIKLTCFGYCIVVAKSELIQNTYVELP